MKPVGNLRDIQWCVIGFLAVQTLLQVFARFAYPTRNLDKGNHLLLQFTITQQAIHCLDKHVDTFVAELIATTGRNNQRIVIQLFAQQGISHFKQTSASSLALA